MIRPICWSRSNTSKSCANVPEEFFNHPRHERTKLFLPRAGRLRSYGRLTRDAQKDQRFGAAAVLIDEFDACRLPAIWALQGNSIGLELYRGGRTASQKPILSSPPAVSVPANAHLGFHPDDTTPIPRPSRYYGRRQDLITRDRAQGRCELEGRPTAGTSIIVPASPGLVPAQIDKSLLTIAEPKRLRDKAHLRFVASQPCLVCGRQPSDPHHLRFAQPRALGLKVSDEFTVPLCRGHHRQLHQAGNELAWWENLRQGPNGKLMAKQKLGANTPEICGD
jgi:hypothetical protein